MSQTAYNLNMGTAFAGMKADSRFDLVESARAYNAVGFGLAVGNDAGEEGINKVVRDKVVLVFDANFVASNVITVTLNGTALDGVTYATSHANTATLLLNALNAVSGVVATKDSTGRIFTVRTRGVAITCTAAVTLGGSQAACTSQYVSCENLVRLDFDADLITANVILVRVNGKLCSAVAFNTSHAQTGADLVTEIELHQDVVNAILVANGANAGRSIVVFTKDANPTISAVVTGGASQAVATSAAVQGALKTFKGVSLHRHTQANGAYAANDIADVLRQGMVWVEVSEAVEKDDDAYVDMAVGGAGKFCDTAANNLRTGCKFRSTTTGSGIALLELNLPN